jgi:hypothetical protein
MQILNESITMCLEINQFTQNIRQHNSIYSTVRLHVSQHSREGNHIHGIEQGQPRGMKNRGQNNELQVSLPNN